jgi:3'(2'), 5'-bisphosphate nucleotidase
MHTLNNIEIQTVLDILKDAGREVLKIYQRYLASNTLNHEIKDDQSPLTEADLISNKIICHALKKAFSHIPIVSEEAHKNSQEQELFWLVDPLDGTKEFIQKRDEFTVNIALICNRVPIFGFIDAPALGICFWAGKDFGSYKVIEGNFVPLSFQGKVLKNSSVKIAVSRHHLSQETKQYIKQFPDAELVEIGSSIKFCYLAEGIVDIYPRHGPTYEWDTAAGQAILTYAGGEVKSSDGEDLIYGKASYLNPSFIARGPQLT